MTFPPAFPTIPRIQIPTASTAASTSSIPGVSTIPTSAPRPRRRDASSERLSPPGTMTNEMLVEFVKKRIYRNSKLYADDFSRFRKAELYDQSRQWNRRARSTSDSATVSQWEPMTYNPEDPLALPLPVYNEGVLLRENESARLGRPEYKPRVRPRSANPDVKEKDGAEGAERALQSRLKEMWGSQEDVFFLHPPLYGGVWLLSYWDETWLDTVRVPAPSLSCPRHPNSGIPMDAPVRMGPPLLANQDLGLSGEMGEGADDDSASSLAGGPGMMQGLSPAPAPSPISCSYVRKKTPSEMTPEESAADRAPRPLEPETSASASVSPDGGTCPMCPDHPQLVPYSPSMKEALGDLGRDLPKGDWFMKVVFPYQIFVRDAGINIDPTNIPEWVYVHVETIEWAESRWPDKVRDLSTGDLRVHPDNAANLMVVDPTLGAQSLLRDAAHLDGVFRENVVVMEYHKLPWLEWDPETSRYAKNLGRSIIIVGDIPVVDSTLLAASLNQPNQYVPKVQLSFTPWEYIDGGRRTTVGQSLWDRLFDAQDGINERISQVRAVNQRGALPWYLQSRSSNFETVQADSAVPFRRVLCDFEGNQTQLPLQLMNNTTIDAGVYQELSFTIQYINKQVVEVERGQVPPGVGAATAIAYLKTESGEKRRPRIKRLRETLVRAWNHGVQCMAAWYIEPRPYSYTDEGGEERHAFIHGDVIAAAKPKVDIYPTPDYDVQDLRRENIRDMVQQGILNPTQTPQLNRKVVNAMDESLDFFVDDDLQEEQASREWGLFKDEGKVPVVDPSLDDPTTHYQDHGRKCFTEWFRQKEDEANWDGALQILGGDWEDSLKKLAQMVAMPAPQPQLALPGVPGIPGIPGMPPEGIAGAAGAAAGVAGPFPPAPAPAPPMPFPTPPPSPPLSLQNQILGLWKSKLQLFGFTPPNPQSLDTVLQWRAHTEAHKLAGEVQALKQQLSAAPAMTAPGQGSSPTSPAEAQAGVPQ